VQNLGASDARERIPGMSSAKIPLLAPLVNIKNTQKKEKILSFPNEVDTALLENGNESSHEDGKHSTCQRRSVALLPFPDDLVRAMKISLFPRAQSLQRCLSAESMGDQNKDLALEEDFEPDESHVLAVNQAVAKLAQHDELIKLGMDDDFVKAVMKAFGGNGPYRAVRKAFCQLLRLPDASKLTILKLREMDVELAPAGDGDIIPVGPFGYVTPGTSAFVYARRAVLKSLIAALLVALNADRQAQALAPVETVDYGAYGTNAADFETAVFSLLSYAMASTGEGLLVGARSEIKELRDLVHKERLRERTLTQKGIGNQMIVKLISVLFAKTQYMVAYNQVANSIGCGHLLPSIRSKYFPICARTTPESLNPFGDTRNAVLGKNVYDTCVKKLLSPYTCLYLSVLLLFDRLCEKD